MIGWLLIAIGTVTLAPTLNRVVQQTPQKFLPAHTESVIAKQLLAQFGQDAQAASNAVLLLTRDAGLLPADLDWWHARMADLDSRQHELGLAGVLTSSAQPQLAQRLISEDRTTILAIAYLPHSDFDEATKHSLTQLKQLIANAPAGATASLTGTAAISQDFETTSRQGLRLTEWLTIGLVLVILLLVFRSPIAPIVPLFTIGISYIMARGLIGATGSLGLPVSNFTESFLIAVLFGAGTDYCILILQRYREELGRTASPAAALASAMTGIGRTLLFAASTVFIAFMLLGLAQFGLYKSAIGVALGLAVTLLAVLTLTPALILLFGNRLFWPKPLEAAVAKSSTFSIKCAALTTKRPLLVLMSALIMLTPLIGFFEGKRSFDDIAELDPKLSSISGFRSAERAFSAGELFPLTYVVRSSTSFRSTSALAAVEQISAALAQVDGVHEVRSAARPLGRQIRVPVDQPEAGGGNRLDAAQQSALAKGIQSLVIGAVSLSQGFVGQLAAIKPFSEALEPVVQELMNAQVVLQDFDQWLKRMNRAPSTTQPTADYLEAEFGQALDIYLSQDGMATKFDIILDMNPYLTEAMDLSVTIGKQLRQSVSASILASPEVYGTGTSVVYNELRELSGQDFIRIGALIFVAIGLVLFSLLRTLLIPIIVLLSLGLNYFVTMGLTELLFVRLLGYPGLSWTASFFIFLIIVALGVDYSIFLMSRFKEERTNSDVPSDIAMTRSIRSTGGIILTAALIMGCTFGALAFSGLAMLMQIGIGALIGLMLYAIVFIHLVVPASFNLMNRRTHPTSNRTQ